MSIIIVKFITVGEPAAQFARICELVGRHRVRKAHRLFPGEAEPDLATMFEVELESDASVDVAVDSLSRDAQVQYAHEPQERKP